MKLTLITLRCRGKQISAFIMCKVFNNKTVITPTQIDNIFKKHFDFIPTRGETISFI